MALHAKLQLRLQKKFEPDSIVSLHYHGLDIAVKTDAEGNAMVAFIGRYDEEGRIRGERYARTLKQKPSGEIIRDHWDRKGKV